MNNETLSFGFSNDFSENDCYFSEFNSEYLFCCAVKDCIFCYRLNKDNYKIIDSYKLNTFENNSQLTIKNNQYFLTFFFISYYRNIASVFQFYIYLPECHNKNYVILNSMNWNKSENDKERLNNLFEVKTNNYYLRLINPPDEYGYFYLNNNKIGKDEHIVDNNYILDFIVTNKNLINTVKLNVSYSIFIFGNGAYSTECQIGLKIHPCYNTCDICSKVRSNSNFTQHNCIKCKINYYFSPEKNGNCYSYKEKEINWYLDLDRAEFAICNEKCKSCLGPTEHECSSCSKGLYLENGSCKDNCSEGYFKIELDKEDYFKCEQCYENCKTCSKKGNEIDMECDSCKEEQIKYKNNCYNITNQTNKYFYDPESDNSKSSCKQKYNKYIKEDSNECIDLPGNDEGYYISNKETGVLSKCHENCLSCRNGLIYDNQKYLISMECSECKDSQNDKKTMIKVNNNCFKIIQYDENQIIFNISEIKPDNPFGNCFAFGKAIFYGQYECIDKPNNTYFALNNNSNTGVIRDCQKVCGSCENKGDRNCIECSTNCNKEERINTYNLFTESISQSSSLNINNILINRCHQNCKSCIDSYNYTIDDMNCFECIDGFYFIYGEKNCYNNSILQNNKY